MDVQPSMILEEDYNPVQSTLQDAETGLYVLNDKGIRPECERAEEVRRQVDAEVVRLIE